VDAKAINLKAGKRPAIFVGIHGRQFRRKMNWFVKLNN
jgi:hypothetical protein